jgi:hypothetical protein
MWSLLAVVAVAAGAPELPPGVVRAPVPDWVLPHEVPVAAQDERSWLLVDDQALLDGPRSVRWTQQVSRMHTRADLQEQARVSVVFDPAEQQVALHQLEVYRDGAWSDRLGTVRAELIRREDALWQDILDGTQTLVLLPEDVARGDVLRASFSVSGDDAGFGAHTAWSWSLAWSVPVARRVVRVGTPEGAPAARWTAHGLTLPPLQTAVDAGGTRWQTLDLADVPVWASPADLPTDEPAQPWLEASTWPDWSAVVAAFAPRYRPEAPEELAAVRAQLDPGEDQAARVVAALRWVQEELRYLGLEMGPGSHTPRPLSAVLRSRYGDCKDKARLLVALLDGWGIRAWPALVDSRGGDPREAAPSPLAFDHVIVAVEWPAAEGGLLWVDPTRTDQGGPGGQPLHEGLVAPEHPAALVLRTGETVPRALPAPAPRHRRATVHWQLTAPSPTPVRARTELGGADADELRAWLTGADALALADWQHPRWAGLGAPLAGPSGGLQWAEQRDRNGLVLREALALDGLWWPEGAGETAVLQAVDLAGWLPVPAPDRTAPLALPGPATWEETALLEGLAAEDLHWPRRTVALPGIALETWSEAGPEDGAPQVAVHWRLTVSADRVEGPALAEVAAGMHHLQDQLTIGVRRENGVLTAQPTTPPPSAPLPPDRPRWAAVGGGVLAGLGLGWVLGARRRRGRERAAAEHSG